MKKLLLTAMLLIMATVSMAAPEALDSIVAKVNDQIITKSELNQRANVFAQQLRAEKVTLPPRPQFLRQVLQMMIDENLQLQMAQRANITVSDTELNQAVTQIAEGQKISRAQLMTDVKKQGLSYAEFTKNLRSQLIVQKLQREIVVPQVSVSPGEVNTYLRSAVNTSQTQYLYHVEDILVGVSDAPTPMELEAAKEKAEQIFIQLEGGSDFRTLAVANSTGQQALHGGDLGWRSLAELPEIFAKQIEGMKQGDLAGPIQTPNGFHIIHLIGIKRNPHAPAATDLKARVGEMLYHQKIEEKLQIWIQQLRAQSYVKIYLAK